MEVVRVGVWGDNRWSTEDFRAGTARHDAICHDAMTAHHGGYVVMYLSTLRECATPRVNPDTDYGL